MFSRIHFSDADAILNKILYLTCQQNILIPVGHFIKEERMISLYIIFMSTNPFKKAR